MTAAPFIPVLTALLLAPLLPGVANRVKAAVAGRRGPSPLQLYYDLGKLLRKGAVYSRTTTWLFRAAPSVVLAAALAALPLLPAPGADAPVSFEGSMLLFAGLLALGRFAIMCAALDTGSSFEGMGASREAQYGTLSEPAVLLALAALAGASGSLSLGRLFGAETLSGSSLAAPAVGLLVVALLIVTLAENSRVPFDDPDTHLELTMVHEVMILDYGGPDLAFCLYASSLKLWLFGALVVNLALPASPCHPAEAAGRLACGELIVAVAVGAVESGMARLRLLKAPHLLLAAQALAALAMVLLLRRAA
jgi:formate hydrogenlyase subunit 4